MTRRRGRETIVERAPLFGRPLVCGGTPVSRLPTGTVTFLFADVEGSTDLLQRLGDAPYAVVLAEFRGLLATACAHGGSAVATEGDGSLFVFERVSDAAAAAIAAQRLLSVHRWPEGIPLRARMGLHTGEAVLIAGDYAGLDVNRAARICGAGHGGQVLVSRATAALLAAHLPEDAGLRDLGPHHLKDLPEPERIFQVVHADLPADFPPLRVPSERIPHNLPRQLTSFVGREREMADVKRRLAAAPLLTLTGPGGCGKTRLALQVAADVLEAYRDGVWLVDLAPVADPGLVPQAVASSLRLRDVPGRAIADTLLAYLRSREALLILDNCEHLVEACAHLADALLRASPRLRILATSREPLGIAGEISWPVPSLSVPDADHIEPEALMRSEAARLFAERARAVQPVFAMTAETAPAVGTICRQLDGIPLAIELAAARAAGMTVGQIAARLDDRFRLLTQGSRAALPRQRTLEAAIEWSYRLLSEQEQTLLPRLSVFAGGWTLDAAEAVGAGGGIETPAVLDLLTRLVFKSLVSMDGQGGDVRYRLLETVRRYGWDRLRQSGALADARRRHYEWCLRLAERAEPELIGPSQEEWLGRLAVEHDNLVGALEWAQETGEAEAGLRLAEAIWRYWYIRGHFAEGRAWLETLLRRAAAAPASLRAKASGEAGFLAILQGDYGSGRLLLDEGLKISRALGDQKIIALLQHQMAVAAHYEGDDATALALYEESLATRRQIGDTPGVAMTLNNLGQLRVYNEDYPAARTLFAQSVDLWRGAGDQRNLAMALSNLGLVAARQGDTSAARSVLGESLGIRSRLADKHGLAYSLEAFADLAVEESDAVRAAHLLAAAEVLRESIGAPLPPTGRSTHERRMTAIRSRLGVSAFAAAWAEGRSMTLDDAIGEALCRDVRQSNGRTRPG
jgi:predicted ATPase/class 3 adenylate cyclase/Tfp pilus assembly protein PilF